VKLYVTPQITICLDEATEQKARSAAKRAGKSLPAWLREIEVAPEAEWSRGFESLFGSIEDERLLPPKRLKPEPVDA
jgi:hypothetical protein